MNRNDYSGVIENWKADLVVCLARRRGFAESDLDDVQQEMVLEVLSFQHDPASDVTEKTALTTMVDRRLIDLRRRWNRQRRPTAPLSMEESAPPTTDAALVLDVRDAMEILSAVEQEVCRGIAGGETPEEIRQRIGLSWRQMRRMLDRIREQFAGAGLDGWLPRRKG